MKRKHRFTILRQLKTFNDPALKVVCKETDLETAVPIITRMFQVLSATDNGAGIAANQIGEDIRVIVIRPRKGVMFAMVNPVRVSFSPQTTKEAEGCLSYPGRFKQIERFKSIEVKYMDEKGCVGTEDFEGKTARIIQHEMDHLDGKCLVVEK